MKFKVGDRLISKEDFEGNATHTPILYKGGYYHILEVEVDGRYIKVESGYSYDFDDKNKGHFYFTYKEINENEPFYVWKYFYTIEEMRKLKLDKINGN